MQGVRQQNFNERSQGHPQRAGGSVVEMLFPFRFLRGSFG